MRKTMLAAFHSGDAYAKLHADYESVIREQNLAIGTSTPYKETAGIESEIGLQNEKTLESYCQICYI